MDSFKFNKTSETELSKLDNTPNNAGIQLIESRSFTETAVAGTYTATVTIPTNAVVLDVIFKNSVVWNNSGTAVLNVGDADDPDGYITNVDVKTAPAADVNGAGGISSKNEDTGTGAYKGLIKKYTTGGTITATIVTAGATGTAGRSSLYVIYTMNDKVVSATKV